MKIDWNAIHDIVQLAINEDIGSGDITSAAIFSSDEHTCCRIIAKEDGVFCGKDILSILYEHIDPDVVVLSCLEDGFSVSQGATIAELHGPTIKLLEGERVALNFIQRMSGIATETSRYVRMLEGSSIKLLDTRKTLPGFRIIDKYAVSTGGGKNHRMGLYDMVMIKDNHIKAAGCIREAVHRIRDSYGNNYKIEIEVSTIEQVREAVLSPVDIIMLDNMKNHEIEESITIINKRTQIEVSGNISFNRIEELKTMAIDFISVGALTHSAKALDISMQFE